MAAENQVLTFALAIYLGTTISAFFTAVTRDLFLPLLSPISSVEGGIAKYNIQIGSIKLNIGDVVVQTMNMLIVFAVVSITLPYIREYVPVAGRR
jgi:large-conductance mechanosensitive channel